MLAYWKYIILIFYSHIHIEYKNIWRNVWFLDINLIGRRLFSNKLNCQSRPEPTKLIWYSFSPREDVSNIKNGKRLVKIKEMIGGISFVSNAFTTSWNERFNVVNRRWHRLSTACLHRWCGWRHWRRNTCNSLWWRHRAWPGGTLSKHVWKF